MGIDELSRQPIRAEETQLTGPSLPKLLTPVNSLVDLEYPGRKKP